MREAPAWQLGLHHERTVGKCSHIPQEKEKRKFLDTTVIKLSHPMTQKHHTQLSAVAEEQGHIFLLLPGMKALQVTPFPSLHCITAF